MSSPTIVTERIDGLPADTSIFDIERQEDLLLSRPDPGPLRLWADYEPLKIAHLAQHYIAASFAPPKDVYCGDYLRLEWQQMNNRQPFYHRNADVDEISYQVSGSRVLSTELGVVDLGPGDYTRIPVSVAHDNFGKKEDHLLFYIHGPTTEAEEDHTDRLSEYKMPPFSGWSGKVVTEMLTECLGTPDCTIAVCETDETQLLERARDANTLKMRVLRSRGLLVDSATKSTTWMYQTSRVWIGDIHLKAEKGLVYTRHRLAYEIQCQISGKRTLVSQHGMVVLEPGDFVCIPRGCAFTSIVKDESHHVAVVSVEKPALKLPGRAAGPLSMDAILAARQ